MTEEDMKKELDNIIEEIEEKNRARSLSDKYLRENGNSTRDEIGIGEYAYGIVMIPVDWVYPYLIKLRAGIDREKEKDNLIQTQQEENKRLEYIKRNFDYAVQKETQKKDKIIDEMLEEYEYNVRINIKYFCDEEMRKDKCIQDCKNCIKQYFERKIENE